eukprot:TRINITY_DN454_c0_g1_i12.p1 TRINITY_DN454_c0_g1~~TRINITY_DN454_c0_g1_i12.p1  ORF type:complete len:116 (+),score=6.65 TRINITY_DN454_c0_g1_i12:352-699(+)
MNANYVVYSLDYFEKRNFEESIDSITNSYINGTFQFVTVLETQPKQWLAKFAQRCYRPHFLLVESTGHLRFSFSLSRLLISLAQTSSPTNPIGLVGTSRLLDHSSRVSHICSECT